MKNMTLLLIFFVLTAIASIPSVAFAQENKDLEQGQVTKAGINGLALAPARFELTMSPGSEKTIIVNLIYSATTNEARPTKLVATLADWDILKNGSLEIYPAGTKPNSAYPWLIYSPSETTAIPNTTNFIRVTISVPKDATPGDHLTALLVERRPDNIKLEGNRGQVVVNFRLAALFYIMVPALTTKGSLVNLQAQVDKGNATIIATLKNQGNTHLRPAHSLRIVSSEGKSMLVEIPETDITPLLSGTEMSIPLKINQSLPIGKYLVQYRVNFKDGQEITEGQLDLVVNESSH